MLFRHNLHGPAYARIEALLATVPADDLRAARERLIAAEAADVNSLEAHHVYKEALIAIRAAEDRCHELRLADPHRMPMGGDAVRLAGSSGWGGVKPGAIGVLDGMVGEPKSPEDSVAITFAYSAFRGPSSSWSPDMPCCSCSGGPGTIATPVADLTRTAENVRIHFWRWKELPCAHGGESYDLLVPLWEWRPHA